VLDVHLYRLTRNSQPDCQLPGSEITTDEGDIEVSSSRLDHPEKKRKLMRGGSLPIQNPPEVTTGGREQRDRTRHNERPSQRNNVASNSTHVVDPESIALFTETPRYSQLEVVVERYGRTDSSQDSQRREQQAEDLFKTRIPAMYGWTDRLEWIHFISQLPERLWIGACLESHRCNKGLSVDARDFLERFGQGKSGSERAASPWGPDVHREALQDAAQQFMVRQCTWLLRDATQKRRLPEYPVEGLNGKEIRINQQGRLAFRVVQPHGQRHTINMKLGHLSPLVPLGPDDRRTIHFTESGIDIRNPQGDTFLLNRQKGKVVTFPVSEISSYGCGSDLVAIWERITRRGHPKSAGNPGMSSWENREASVLADHPPRVGPTNTLAAEKKGHSIPLKVPKAGVPKEPPKADDALWLLNEYLNQYFPDGGYFWTGDKASFPKSTDDKNRFLE